MPTEDMNIRVTLKNAAARGLKSLDDDISKVSKTTKTAATSMKGLYAQLLAIGAVVASGAFLGGAVKTFADFDDNMRAAGAVTSATADQMDKMTAAAKKMGRETRYTAANAAEALRFLGMAGFAAEEATSALPGVLKLAAAGALDLGTAADIATNVLTSFGIEVERLADVNDILVKTFTSSNVNLVEIGEAFKLVGPIAKGVGADFEDLVGSIGALGNAGLKGTMAGTALKGAISALLAPTAQEAALMENLKDRLGGVSLQVKDSSGDFIGFRKIVEQLEKAGVRGEESLRLFGERAGPGMAALINQGSKSLALLVDKLKDAGYTSEEIAKIMEGGIGGQFRKTISVIEAFKISIGDALGPEIIQFLEAFREAIEDLEINIIQMKQSGDFEGWGDAIVSVFNGISFAVKKTVQLFNIIGNLGNIFLATLAGDFESATSELLRFKDTVDKFLGIYQDPEPVHFFKIDQEQRKKVEAESKRIFAAIGKGAANADIPEALIPTASLASKLKAALIKLNAELDVQAQKIEQDYAGGLIKLDEYYAKRLEVVKKRSAKEVEILQDRLRTETDINKKVILNAQVFALDQKLVADSISLEIEKQAAQDKIDDDRLKKIKTINGLKEKAEKAYQDQKARIIGEGVTTLDTQFASEIAALQTKQNNELDVVKEYHDERLQALKDAKASEFEIEKAFQERKKALSDQIAGQQAEQEQMQADQALRLSEYKLQTMENLAAGTAQMFTQLYELSGKKSKEFFFLAKAAAIAEATMKVAAGIAGALGSPPYGLGAIANATIIGSLGAIQIATIASQGLAEGGQVKGSSPNKTADDKLIRATAGEFMHPVDAVRYYGIEAMEGIRTKSIPREVLSGFQMKVKSPGIRYGRSSFASGGGISASSGINTANSGDNGMPNITIINVDDPRKIDQYLATAPGQDAVLNVIGARPEAATRLLKKGGA